MIFNFVSETDTLMETDFIKATESGKKGTQEFTKVNLFYPLGHGLWRKG